MTADTIIVSTVLQVQATRWDTLDGGRPSDACGGPPDHRIYTPVVGRVEQIVKGMLTPAQTIIVQGYGGTVGQDRLFQTPDTSYAAGERDLLFLSSRGGAVNATVRRYLIDDAGLATNATDPTEKLPLQQLLDDIAPVHPR